MGLIGRVDDEEGHLSACAHDDVSGCFGVDDVGCCLLRDGRML